MVRIEMVLDICQNLILIACKAKKFGHGYRGCAGSCIGVWSEFKGILVKTWIYIPDCPNLFGYCEVWVKSNHG